MSFIKFFCSKICRIYRHDFIQRQLSIISIKYNKDNASDEDSMDIIDGDSDYETLLDEYLNVAPEQKCFIIHPYVKWGPRKVKTSTPESQLEEAVALVDSLQTWKVFDKIIVPLETLQKKTVFGTGTLSKLTQTIKMNPSITAVFINMGTLKSIQLKELERIFGLPIFDRYNIVMQIFRLHAVSKHAKLQVSLTEVGFLWSKLKKQDTDFVVSTKLETRNFMLQTREKKIRNAIKKLKSERELLRRKRMKIDFPIVAVVGYTNVGKTSLIKALTGDKNLTPRNQLFATLDITFHAGLLPSTQKVLYVDTVGFLSDIPTGLIECFNATLEDAMLADVILHVEDLSSPDYLHQQAHVINTLKILSEGMGVSNVKEKIITVGNKCDKSINDDNSIVKVSAKNGTGVNLLKQRIEEAILKITNRHIISISLPVGGEEVRWLYKNATVVSVVEDQSDAQNNIVKVIITGARLNQFKHNFAT